MKKKYLLILLMTLFFLTGCESTYNLNINRDTMTESINFLIDNNKENKSILNQYLSSTYMAFYDMDTRKTYNYEKKEIEKKNKIGMNLLQNYAEDNLQHSSLLNQCYYIKSVIKTENSIIITTDGNNRCFYKDGQKQLDKLTINITTDLKVTENNADKVKKNTYTWNITQDNFQNHPITIKMNIPKEKSKEEITFNFIIIIVVIIIIAIIGVLGYLYLKHKQRKSNEF